MVSKATRWVSDQEVMHDGSGIGREGRAMVAVGQIMRDTEDDMRYIAERLESDNPLWVVLYGVYSKQFVAFPRFAAPRGTVIAVSYPGAMSVRMRQVEHAASVT
jgi:hypothetical protein